MLLHCTDSFLCTLCNTYCILLLKMYSEKNSLIQRDNFLFTESKILNITCRYQTRHGELNFVPSGGRRSAL